MNRKRHTDLLMGFMFIAAGATGVIAAAPSEGSEAPNFKLKVLGDKDKAEFELASFRGKKPVVLIFGSYT